MATMTTPLLAPPPGKTFEVAKQGQQQAVLAEVRDLGINKITTNFNGVSKTEDVHQILFRWQLSEIDAESKEPKRIYEKFRFSVHEKAKLYKRLAGMFGGRIPPKDYDYRKLEGLNFDLMIVHNVGKDGKTYANIVGTIPVPNDRPKLTVVAIAAPKDKSTPAAQQQDVAAVFGSGNAVTAAAPITDDDIPF
jgi:hypothetical protein